MCGEYFSEYKMHESRTALNSESFIKDILLMNSLSRR